MNPSQPPQPPCGIHEERIQRRRARVAELLERAQQRQIRMEMSATRIRITREQRVAELEARRADDAAAEERAWLRAEVRSMLDTGWTPEELREIGFGEWIPSRDR